MEQVHIISPAVNITSGNYDGILLFIKPESKADDLRKVCGDAGAHIAAGIKTFSEKVKFKFGAASLLTFDLSPSQRLAVAVLPKELNTYSLLELAKQSLKPFHKAKTSHLCALSGHLDVETQIALAEALVAAKGAAEFTPPHYGKRSAEENATHRVALSLTIQDDRQDAANKILKGTQSSTDGTNLARTLAMMAGNDLTCAKYQQLAADYAKKWQLTYEFINYDQLEKLKAGAFLAVAKGSGHRDAGIAKLSYRPKTTAQHRVALVGKGIVFDTGGHNLKPSASMFGMHGDMAGSAVVLGLLQTAVEEGWSIAIDGYLAISDNMISPQAYKQNDIVTAMNGKSIEIMHTDAEGRMVLADTLTIASKDQPHLVMDFATLTGACIGAIGTTYSGVFTNRPAWNQGLIDAGKKSGERVWPFPVDEDFGRCLESKVADIKQCRIKGGVDHIEAAYFLRQFLHNDVPWIHMDLSAIENDDGLGHISTKETGFGVRVAREILLSGKFF